MSQLRRQKRPVEYEMMPLWVPMLIPAIMGGLYLLVVVWRLYLGLPLR